MSPMARFGKNRSIMDRGRNLTWWGATIARGFPRLECALRTRVASVAVGLPTEWGWLSWGRDGEVLSRDGRGFLQLPS